MAGCCWPRSLAVSGATVAPAPRPRRPSAQQQPRPPSRPFDTCADPTLPLDAGYALLDETVGQGELATAERLASLRFEFTRADGGVLDSNFDAGEPFGLLLGSGKGLPALERVARCMRGGGERTVRASAATFFDARALSSVRAAPTEPLQLRLRVVEVQFVIVPEPPPAAR